MLTIVYKLSALTEQLGRIVSWATLLMLLLTLLVVILRYLFNTGATGLQDTALYLHGAVFTLAAGYTLKHDGHVRVDIFYRKLSANTRLWIDLLGTLFLLLPTSLFIGWASWGYVLQSWQIQETSVEAGGLPLVFVQKSLLLGLVISLVIQGICDATRYALMLLKGENL